MFVTEDPQVDELEGSTVRVFAKTHVPTQRFEQYERSRLKRIQKMQE
jgi:hypothetical protein